MNNSRIRVAFLHTDPNSRKTIVKMCTADVAVAFVILPQSATAQDIVSARPDVLLIDGRLPNALTICSDLGHDNRPWVIFVDVPRAGELALEALRAGARGIVFDGDPAIDVLRAIELVHLDGVWAPRTVLLAAMRHSRQDDRRRAVEQTILARLSPREIEVLRHAVAGLGNKELAERLSISRSTVKAHLTHIFQKLGIQTRVELAAAYHSVMPSSEYERIITPPPYSIRRRPAGHGRES